MPIHALTIPDWHPARLNEFVGRHWSVGARLKRRDRDLIAAYALAAGVPKATGRRRVTVKLVMAPRQRRPDPDSLWKSCLDGLVRAGLLRDDNPKWCELRPLEYERGAEKATVITLEDLTDE